MESSTKHRVAILGGGVSGILAARVYLQEKDVQVVLFEQTQELGGVWAENYHKYGVQTPCRYYAFPDDPLPKSMDFTDGEELKKYIYNYAERHGVTKVVRFNTKVTAMRAIPAKVGATKWELTVSETREGGDNVETLEFDQVLVASGVYSRTEPYRPKFDGEEAFLKSGGKITHSAHFNGEQQLQGKHVVTVGYGKSAFDCSLFAKKEYGAGSSTILFREAHWPVPRKILGCVPFEYATFSRAGCALLTPDYKFLKGKSPNGVQQGLHGVFHSCLPPCVLQGVWWAVENVFACQFGFFGKNKHCRPKTDFLSDFWCGHGILPSPDFFSSVSDGTLQAKEGSIAELGDKSLKLKTGEALPCDHLVLATGFRPMLSFMGKEFLQAHMEEDGLWLYRNMLLPEHGASLVFLNSNTTTFTNITTAAIQSRWALEALLERNIQLPSSELMQEQIQLTKKWKREGMPQAGSSRAVMVQTHQVNYYDELLSDMGVSTYRKGNIFSEIFDPYCCADYKGVVTGESLAQGSESLKGA